MRKKRAKQKLDTKRNLASKPVSFSAAAKILDTRISVLRDLAFYLPDPVRLTKSGRPQYNPNELWIFWRTMGYSIKESKDMIARQSL
jgi:hypothetical protein